MAIESVATEAIKPIDYKEGYLKLSSEIGGLCLDLLKIKAIALMVSESNDFNKAEFPEEIYGGVLAIFEIASRAHDQAGTAG